MYYAKHFVSKSELSLTASTLVAESMMLADYRCNVHSVYHRDGLIDLAFGTIFLLLSISILTDTTLYSLFSGMVIFGYLYLKYVVITPGRDMPDFIV